MRPADQHRASSIAGQQHRGPAASRASSIAGHSIAGHSIAGHSIAGHSIAPAVPASSGPRTSPATRRTSAEG